MDYKRDMADCKINQDTKDHKLCKMMIEETMGRDGPRRVLLTGKSGIGKTRLARMVGKYATDIGLCYLTICLHLNNKFEDELSLFENIAFQIGAYNRDDKEEKKPEDLLKDLKEKITAKLGEMKRLAYRKAMQEKAKRNRSWAQMWYLLLILDDEGNKTSEDKVMKELGLEGFLKDHAPLKIIITRGYQSTTVSDEETNSHATEDPQDTVSDEETNSHATYELQDTKSEGEIESHATEDPQDTVSGGIIEPEQLLNTLHEYTLQEFHTTDYSESLLTTLHENNLQDLFVSLLKGRSLDLLESLRIAWEINEPFSSLVARNSIGLPAAIVVVAKSLNCITHHNTFNCLSSKQEKVLKEVLFRRHPAYSVSGYNPILQLSYQLLETDDTLKNAIVDCFWHSLDVFKLCGAIHYSELITQWILEGYFDPVRSVKKAYDDGHVILMELIKRGILKIQDGDMVVPEMAMDNLIDLRHHGLLSRSRLRFPRVYGGDKNKGLGNITQIDDMIKTVQAKKQDNNCTLLVSGNRLRREIPTEFFEQMAGLEVLALFDPTFECLTKCIKDLSKLRVLVIRNCDLLSDIEELRSLRGLHVLEVSGASSVKMISDDFFTSMPELQTLNLSELWIKNSPSSISQLKHLGSLILRDCPVLEDLPNIQGLEELEFVDVRGAHNLKTCFGREFHTCINQTFSSLRQLQLLDFSESKIKRLPMFHDPAEGKPLHSLTRLSLQNCSNLIKLPNLRPLTGLHILDLSGTTSLVDIAAVCFEEKKELKILNLSGTKFTKLPATIFELPNLSQLLLRDSSNLEVIPNIKGLISLEVFDVSGCTNLHKIEGSFGYMYYLCKVNLSGTRIETLPELPRESNIFCSKLVILADSTRWLHDTWGEVEEAMKNGISMSVSSSDMADSYQEISRKESGKVKEKQLNEAWAFDCPEKNRRIYRDIYMHTIPFIDTKSHQEILEIQGSNGVVQDKETLAKAEFVAFVEISAASLSSVFNDLESVKGCWLKMCGDIEILFSDIDEERLRNLETLSIKNLRLMDSICSGIFKNLKKLSLDCCPSLITLFYASAPPTSLEILKIKFCVKLEIVFEEAVELPNLHTLCLFELPLLSALRATLPNLERFKKDRCPKLKSSQEDLRRGNGSDEILFDLDCKKVEHGEDI